VQRNRAAHAIVSVDLRHLQLVEAAVLVQEFVLYLDGLALSLLLGLTRR
jgi:hypothetical protein